jgi:hypothetical protein
MQTGAHGRFWFLRRLKHGLHSILSPIADDFQHISPATSLINLRNLLGSTAG